MEEERFELREPLQLVDVGGPNNVVKTHILERNLFHSLLEVWVVEDLQSVSVNEQLIVPLDLCVAALDEAF